MWDTLTTIYCIYRLQCSTYLLQRRRLLGDGAILRHIAIEVCQIERRSCLSYLFQPVHENWDTQLGEELDEVGDPPRVWLSSLDQPGCAFTRCNSTVDVISEDPSTAFSCRWSTQHFTIPLRSQGKRTPALRRRDQLISKQRPHMWYTTTVQHLRRL